LRSNASRASGLVGQTATSKPSRAAASGDAEKIAGRIVEYGTAVEEANWSMLCGIDLRIKGPCPSRAGQG